MHRQIFKQSSLLFAAQSLAKFISLLFVFYLAKNFSVSEFGIYSIALTYFSVFAAISDLGFGRYISREVAIEPKNAGTILAQANVFKFLIVGFLYLIFAIGLFFFDPDRTRVNYSILALLAVLPLSLAQNIDAIFVALKSLQYSAIALLTLNISSVILAIFLIEKGYGVSGAVLALVLSNFVYLFISLAMLMQKKISFKFVFKNENYQKIIKGSLPYGILTVLGFLYFRVDTLMLAYLKGDYQTGIYSAAYRFLEGINFFPASVNLALFPIMVNLHLENPGGLYSVYKKWLKIMFLLSIPVTLVFIFLIPLLIKNYLPNYQDALPLITILGLTIPFLFLTSPQGAVFLSSGKYLKMTIYISLSNLIINVLGNLILIPQFGFMGAAWMTLISYIFGFLLFFIIIRKYFRHAK